LDNEETINTIINADLSPVYQQPVIPSSNTTDNITITDTNTTDNSSTDANVTDEVVPAEDAKPVEWKIKKNGSEVFKKIEELNALESTQKFTFQIGEKTNKYEQIEITELPYNTKAYYFPNATSQKNFTDSTSLEILGEVYYAAGEGEEASEYWNPDQKIYVEVGDIIDTTVIPNLTLEINESNKNVFRWIRYRPIG